MAKKRDVIEHIRQFAADPIRYRPGVTSTLAIGPDECDQILAAIDRAADDPPRPDYGELARLIREIADRDAEPLWPNERSGRSADDWECVYCWERGESAGKVDHAANCLWVRARQLAARLPKEDA